MITDIRIRAFRATDDPETCKKYVEGHRKVLENHGIHKVSSSNEQWPSLRSVFVIVVENIDGSRLYGGARIHATDGVHRLPIEEAVYEMDPRISDVVKYYAQFGAGELSGLWNSKEVAGFGIGSLFPSRVAVAMAEELGLQIMFSLCSPMTVRFKDWIGGIELVSVGNRGTFYYPKLDLLATALYSDDIINLPLAHPRERQKIFFLRKNLKHVASEKSPFKNVNINIHYDLEIKNADTNEFKIAL
jgi:hypothetical protein